MPDDKLDIEFLDEPTPKNVEIKKDEPGASWLNYLMFQRKGQRGDLVATMAFLAFACLLFSTVFGGSSFKIADTTFKISSIGWENSVPLMTVIVGYILKSGYEKGK